MRNLFIYLTRLKYFNRWLILVTDLIISVFVTLFSFLFAVYFIGNSVPEGNFLRIVVLSVLCSFGSFLLFSTYKGIIRHSTLWEVWRIGAAILCKGVLLLGGIKIMGTLLSDNQIILGVMIDFLLSTFALLTLRITLITIYNILMSTLYPDMKHILIYGTGGKSAALAGTMIKDNPYGYRISGFLTFGKRYKSYRISGYSVYYIENQEDFNALMKRNQITGIVFTDYETIQGEQDRIVHYCGKAGIKMLVVPQLDEVIDGKVEPRQIREISIEDLLGRDEIKLSMDDICAFLKNKVVLITGAAGSIGSELCRQLAAFGVDRLILFDSAETPMHTIRLELEDRFPGLNFTPVIGDVRSKDRIDFVFRTYHPAIVFHAAAYKHVPLMEANPCEAVQVNVYGTRNVADFAVKYGVEKFVMISTDKAVNPTNVMGASKRMAEIYVQSLSIAIRNGNIKGNTRFITTRFGNVLGSNGSVIPRFKEQIQRGGPVTVTHPDIIRYFMTIPEACRLVMEAATMGKGAEIFIFDMGKPVRIADLACRMIELAGFVPGKDIAIKYTGLRPGEKLYEELLNKKENTQPTCHKKIRIASVRESNYTEISLLIDKLTDLSVHVDIPETVKLMKEAVPEFLSRNSVYQQFDK